MLIKEDPKPVRIQCLYRPSNDFSLSSTLFFAASLALSAAASSLDITFGFWSSRFRLLGVSVEGAPLTALVGFNGFETTGPGAEAPLMPGLFSETGEASFNGNGFWKMGFFWLEEDDFWIAASNSSCDTHVPVYASLWDHWQLKYS